MERLSEQEQEGVRPQPQATGVDFPPQSAHILRTHRNESLHAWLMAHMRQPRRVNLMNSIIYIVGLIVIVMAILSFIGLA